MRNWRQPAVSGHASTHWQRVGLFLSQPLMQLVSSAVHGLVPTGQCTWTQLLHAELPLFLKVWTWSHTCSSVGMLGAGNDAVDDAIVRGSSHTSIFAGSAVGTSKASEHIVVPPDASD